MVQNTQAPYNIIASDVVTGTRALDTVYTNLTGRTMFVFASIIHHTLTNGEGAAVNVFINGVNVASSGHVNYGLVVIDQSASISFAVPPGQTYEVRKFQNGGAWNQIDRWVESY